MRKLGLGLDLTLGTGTKTTSPLTILSDVVYWSRADFWTPSSFPDHSGKNNNFVQATGANQPTINALDANFNGQPSATFNGTSTFLSASSFTSGVGTDVFVWFVMRLTSASSFPVWWGETTNAHDSNHEARGNASSGDPMMNAGDIAVTAVWGSSVVGVTKAIACYDKGAGAKVGVNVSNGTPVETTRTAGTATIIAPVCIGARAPGASLWAPMTVADIVVCNTMPSSAQLTALQTYAGRYGNV